MKQRLQFYEILRVLYLAKENRDKIYAYLILMQYRIITGSQSTRLNGFIYASPKAVETLKKLVTKECYDLYGPRLDESLKDYDAYILAKE